MNDCTYADVNAILNDIADDGCQAVNTAPSPGKTVLLRQGSGCRSKTRCDNAYDAGFARCLIYWNDENLLPFLGSSFIPSASISKSAGVAINPAGWIRLTWSNSMIVIDRSTIGKYKIIRFFNNALHNV